MTIPHEPNGLQQSNVVLVAPELYRVEEVSLRKLVLLQLLLDP